MPRKFNQILKDAIQDKSRTQADFAHDMHTTEPIVSKVVNGGTLPASDQRAWAEFLGWEGSLLELFPVAEDE